MRATVSLACILALLGVLFWMWSPEWGGRGQSELESRSSRDGSPAAGWGPIEQAELRKSIATDGDREMSASETVLLFGTCVDKSGNPVPGVELLVVRAVDLNLETSVHRRVGLTRRVWSGSRGEFELRVPRVEELLLRSEAPWRIKETVSLSDEKRQDLGEISVERGYRVAGEVVDHTGIPIEESWIEVEGDIAPIRSGRFEFESIGVCCTEVGFPGGELETLSAGVRSSTRNLDASPSLAFDVGPGHDTSSLQIVVQRVPSLSGVLLDEGGEPVAGRDLSVEGGGRPRTGPDGTFKTCSSGLTDEFMRVDAMFNADRRGYVETTPWHRGPMSGLVLTLRKWNRFRLRVVDPSGQPVPKYRLFERWESPTDKNLKRCSEEAGGVAVWIGLSRGLHHIIARTPDGRLSRWEAIRPAEYEKEAKTLRLQPLSSLRIVVEGEIKPGDPWSTSFLPPKESPRVRTYAQVSSGLETSIHVPDQIAGGEVSVSAGKRVGKVRLTAAHEQARIVRVRIALKKKIATGCFELVVPPGQERMVRRMRLSFSLKNSAGRSEYLDAGLRSRTLPVGRWKLYWGGGGKRPGRRLGVVQIKAGMTSTHSWSVAEFQPCRLRVQVFHAGKPLAGTPLRARSRDLRVDVAGYTDAEGRAEFEDLPPGPYEILRTRGLSVGRPSHGWLFLSPSVEAKPGTSDLVKVSTPGRPVRMRVLDADGELVSRRWFEVSDCGSVRSDDRGMVEFLAPPPGFFYLRSHHEPGSPGRSVKVVGDQSRIIEVRLPR